ncbi:MAG: alpha/beta fold hydrolase [Pseudohongiellaceae bacterium]
MRTTRSKLEFTSNDTTLAGLLETPATGPVQAYALFAHCFTCGKDLAVASRISRALVARGFAVLRFDFTGLGNSDGDFANTNFSSNVDDLVAAADFLRQAHQAPRLLIGHSLGGAAVLKAAARIPEAAAVATIGAPYHAKHVSRQLGEDLERIANDGEAMVDLAGRRFKIKKQFVEDLRDQSSDHISGLRRALLVMHSPVDAIVHIDEAEKIYKAARHPKSFISLDTADHLLTESADAEYAAACISAWAGRFLPEAEVVQQSDSDLAEGQVRVTEKDQVFTQTVQTDSHRWTADEPQSAGGKNLGPDPYEHLLAALGTCTAMTLRMYARHKKLPLKNVTVELAHKREHAEDCSDCSGKLDVLERRISLAGDLSEEQRRRLLEIADRCPVHRTLTSSPEVRTVAVDE